MDSSPQQEEVTRALWAQLRCMCGECDGETLEQCTCDDAAREREKIAELVRAHDTSSPDKVTAVEKEIVRRYVKRFGEKAVVSASSAVWNELLAWVLPPAVVVTGLAVLFVSVERIRRRKEKVSIGARASVSSRAVGKKHGKRKRTSTRE